MKHEDFLDHLEKDYGLDVRHPYKQDKLPPDFLEGARTIVNGDVPDKDWTWTKTEGWIFAAIVNLACFMDDIRQQRKK